MLKHFFLIFLFSTSVQAQSLPEGLGSTIEENFSDFESESPFVFNGFIDGRAGMRTQDQAYQRDVSILETRLHTDVEYEGRSFTGRISADFIYDDISKDENQDFETGKGWMDLREAFVSFRPFDFADVKIGRQILTWGLGDLVFINDLFPKDWNAFFIGRSEDYLKAPSDATKLSLFSDLANLDVTYMARHDASRYIDGSRLSFFNPSVMSPMSEFDPAIDAMERNAFFTEDEVALRLYRSFGSTELALYYFDGYWKTPEGQSAIGVAYFPELTVYGASARIPFFKGILSLEMGYYDSSESNDGLNPLVRNSEYRYLIGYEQELFSNFTANVQYYVEQMDDYDVYLNTLPVGMPIRDEFRELLTLRLTYMLMDQKLILSLFNYYSPTDQDGYVRPKVSYKATDAMLFEVGANIFWGEEDRLSTGIDQQTTFFGQFEDNTNVFVGARYTF
ncbi:MAG: hypothetical protein JW812_03925 [Alphaproteobacteria bacterium]|nr:hypothetical protein [Alphaproteobacteria bacterium]MBN2779599.1 hypothetical protein [Alphaproteobacteria bacterium]